MSKPEYHVQCRLERGNVHTTAWIEEQYAVLDKHVSMEKPDGSWEEGWYVRSVGSKMDSKHVKNFAHNAGDSVWTATSGSCPRGNK